MAKVKLSRGVVHNVPEDLNIALNTDSEATELWESLTPLARNEWICWVTYFKKEETRVGHIKRTLEELKSGKRRPCCWIGCTHRIDKSLSPSIKGILKKQKRIG